MNSMKSRARMLSILGMAAMMDPTLAGVVSGPPSKKPQQRAEPQINMTPPMMLEYLHNVETKFNKKLTEWNTTSSKKLKVWEVYGFEIRGTTIRNATKRMRRFQAESSLQPGITRDQLVAERARLVELVDKTTASGEEE